MNTLVDLWDTAPASECVESNCADVRETNGNATAQIRDAQRAWLLRIGISNPERILAREPMANNT